jgi:hypothetical protein
MSDEEHSQQVDEAGTEQEYGEEKSQEEELYKNNHDLIGVEGIIRAQKNEIEKKKVSHAIDSEART